MKNYQFFEQLHWQEDRMLSGDLVFRLQHYKNDATWELNDHCFIFFKIKPLIDQYARFWAFRPDFQPQLILELGMWDGGSLAFWHEYFQPEKIIGLDLTEREDSVYFQKYITSRHLQQSVRTYWGVNQADVERLNVIVRNEFDTNLDLVIDDASHLYDATKASFETLFPLLRPGGFYIIEDWAWAHWKACQSLWSPQQALTRFVIELIEAAGSSRQLIASLTVFEGFAVIERGYIAQQELSNFHLERFIIHPPSESSRLALLPRLCQKTTKFLCSCIRREKEFFGTSS